MEYKPTWNIKSIPDAVFLAESARRMSEVRWHKPDSRSPEKRGGRPRSKAPRCYCGDNTMKLAKIKAFACCKKAGKYPQKALVSS